MDTMDAMDGMDGMDGMDAVDAESGRGIARSLRNDEWSRGNSSIHHSAFSIHHFFYITPLVDGTPSCRGLIVTAWNNARAKPLKIASVMWWALLP